MTASARSGGQSVTEFALVLPVLMLLLLTISDFGRFFATGITIESATRTAAELAAQELVAEKAAGRSSSTSPFYDYALIHSIAWRSVCAETAGLPNMTPSSGGGQCDSIPTKVCIHDGADSACDTLYNQSSGTVPGQCTGVAAGSSNSIDAQGNMYVEVRVCYRFSTIFQVALPFFSGSLNALSGDFYIDRTRTFTAGDY